MFHHHKHVHCREDALTLAENICAERGSRLTEQRKTVLALIWESPQPVKAYDLLEKLSEIKGKIQPPTIYRALDFLIEEGLIHRIDSLNAFTRCHHPREGHDCFFLICVKCGNADECRSSVLNDTIRETLDGHRFQPERIAIEVSGTCQSCLT